MAGRVEANGVSLHVVDEGEGRALVFLHGVMGSGRFFEAQVDRLRADFRVVVPDMRGHGDSEKTLGGHTVPTYARDLRAVLEEIGATARPVLVGWSMGAMVAYEYLRAFGSGAVGGLVVVDQPPADFAWDGYAFGMFSAEVLAEAVEAIQTDLASVAHGWAELMLHAPTPEAVAFFVEQLTKVPPAIATSILVDQTLRDYRAFIPGIDVPTLVAFGGDDKATDPAAGEWIARAVSGARLEIFEASSHCPFFEEPDRFAEVLRGFVHGL